MFPELDDVYYVGHRPNGVYVPRFRNVSDATRRSEYVRGFGYQGEAFRPGWTRPLRGIGADFKHALRRPGSWEMLFGGYGETLPSHANRVVLDPDVKDAWGMPRAAHQLSVGSERARDAQGYRQRRGRDARCRWRQEHLTV